MYVHPPGGGNFPDGGSGMTYWSAILLGIIQGLAEFLPISSSGHLAILQNFLRIGDLENQMLFDVLLHLGTLGAVIFAYHTELRGLCREGLAMLHIKKLRRGVKPDLPRRRLLLFLIAATLPLIPAALLNDWLDPLFYNTFFIGFALIVTGFLLLAADRFGHGNKTEKAMTLSDAIIIGLAQMIALRYGTIPIVRETGGLKDTVHAFVDYAGTGNGFTFASYNAHDMLHVIREACGVFRFNKPAWSKLIMQGMQSDFSWGSSADKYIEVYKTAMGQ